MLNCFYFGAIKSANVCVTELVFKQQYPYANTSVKLYYKYKKKLCLVWYFSRKIANISHFPLPNFWGKLLAYSSYSYDSTVLFFLFPVTIHKGDFLECCLNLKEEVKIEPNLKLWPVGKWQIPNTGISEMANRIAVGLKFGIRKVLAEHIWGTFDFENYKL